MPLILSKTQLFIEATVLLCCQVAAMPQATRGRLAPKIEIGPTYEFSFSDSQLQRSSKEAAIRGFVWEHWVQKRAGKVTAKFYSIEGDPTIHTFSVRPDRNGRWAIISEIRSCCGRLYYFRKPWQRRESTAVAEAYRSMDRVEPMTEPSSADDTKIIKLEDSDPRPADKYRLRFRSLQTAAGYWFL